MSRIRPALFERLSSQLGLKQAALYKRINRTSAQYGLERAEAAIALAQDSGINVSRYSTQEERAHVAAARRGASPPSTAVVTPTPASSRPSTSAGSRRKVDKKPRRKTRGRKLFVVHGRNGRANRAMFQFLRSLSLDPIEWEKARQATGKANPYVGEILEKAFESAQAVVVLMTPDDEARLQKEFLHEDDERFEMELTGQPRQNVLFEAGYAMGKYPNNVVIVAVGKLRPFSDIGGRHVVRLDGGPERRKALVDRLKSVGLDLDDSGTDWLREGDFIEPAKGAPRKTQARSRK